MRPGLRLQGGTKYTAGREASVHDLVHVHVSLPFHRYKGDESTPGDCYRLDHSAETFMSYLSS